MTENKQQSTYQVYRTVNLVFAGLMGMVILYAGVFSERGRSYPIPSFYERVTGESSPSSGLSRSFSETIRLDFEAAKAYHPHGIRLFSFFFVQFFLRFLFTLVASTGRRRVGDLVMADALVSGALFVYCFWPFLPVWEMV